MKPPATIAWLYGPSASGASSLDTAFRVIARSSTRGARGQPGQGDHAEGRGA